MVECILGNHCPFFEAFRTQGGASRWHTGKEYTDARNVERQVQSPGWEDPLEEEMVIHSSILAWVIPWTKEPGGLQSIGLQRVGHV